jgi:hypothetical protein
LTLGDDTPGPEPRRPSLPNFISFVMAVALVWLGGQFVRQGISDNVLLMGDDAESAMLWMGDSSDAVAQLARDRLHNDPSGAQRLAVRALQLAPLNAPALTTYGLAASALHHRAIANQAMTLSGRRGWRDLVTQVWLFRRDLLNSDFGDAFDHGDALMRRVPEPPPAVLSIFGAAAHDPNALAALAQHLADDPAWRQSFFIFLCLQTQPPATGIAGDLLTRLEASPSPPTDTEVGVYLFTMVRQKKYQEAEAGWRRLTPGGASDGYVHNGNFELPTRLTPFDWQPHNDAGWTADIADSADPSHGRALRIDYDEVSTPQPIRELLVLPAGAFTLSGRVMETGGPQDFSWRVLCLGDATGDTGSKEVIDVPALARVENQWRTFSAPFTIPADDCPAQLLDLVAVPGDLTKQVTVWYDDLSIVRAAAGAARAQPAPVAANPAVPAKP